MEGGQLIDKVISLLKYTGEYNSLNNTSHLTDVLENARHFFGYCGFVLRPIEELDYDAHAAQVVVG